MSHWTNFIESRPFNCHGIEWNPPTSSIYPSSQGGKVHLWAISSPCGLTNNHLFRCSGGGSWCRLLAVCWCTFTGWWWCMWCNRVIHHYNNIISNVFVFYCCGRVSESSRVLLVQTAMRLLMRCAFPLGDINWCRDHDDEWGLVVIKGQVRISKRHDLVQFALNSICMQIYFVLIDETESVGEDHHYLFHPTIYISIIYVDEQKETRSNKSRNCLILCRFKLCSKLNRFFCFVF